VAFDASDWIKNRAEGGLSISQETIKTVADFTMLWNYFEEKFCDTNAEAKVLCKLARRIPEDDPLPMPLTTCLNYWRERYFEDGAFNRNFETLYRQQPRSEPHISWKSLMVRNWQQLTICAPSETGSLMMSEQSR